MAGAVEVLGLALELARPEVQDQLVAVEVERGALHRDHAERGIEPHVCQTDALRLQARRFAQQRAQPPLAPHGVGADAPQRAERQQVAEVLVGVGEQVLHQRPLGGGEHRQLHQAPPRLQQVVPAQHAGAPLREARAAEVELADAVPVAPRPAGAHLALQEHDQLGVEAQHAVEALPAAGVFDLAVALRRFGVGREEHAHQAPALDLSAGGALLGGVDDVRCLHVHRAVGQLALRGLPDRAQ